MFTKMNDNLTVNLPDKKLEIKGDRIYRCLHDCQLLEKRLEEIREFMRKTYYCDYIAIDALNSKADMFFSNLDHDNWHQVYWERYMNNCPTLKITSQLQKGKSGFLFFFDYDNSPTEVRASIIGERKDGFTVMFSNEENGNRMQFSLTFLDNKSIGSFSAKTFNKLLGDLKKMQTIIDDFLGYFDKHQEIKDGKNLEQFISMESYKFPFSS